MIYAYNVHNRASIHQTAVVFHSVKPKNCLMNEVVGLLVQSKSDVVRKIDMAIEDTNPELWSLSSNGSLSERRTESLVI